MLRYLPFIVKNCRRNLRRTILTIFSIAASVCLLGLLFAMYHAFYLSDQTPGQALRLITRNRVSFAVYMPLYYADQIRQVPGVREVMIFQWFGGIYKDARDPKNFFARFAIEPDKLLKIYSEDIVPDDQMKAFRAERSACLIGAGLVEKLGLKLGDRVTIRGDIYPIDLQLTVRAIYDSPHDRDNLFFHWKYLEEAIPASRSKMVEFFSILADKPENVARIASAIDAHFHNSPYETKTESEKAFEVGFVSFLGNVKMFLLSICSALTFTMLLVCANTMAMSVRERIREVGILKTLGFTPGAILGIILGEAEVIAVLGGLVGCALIGLLVNLIRTAPSPMFRDLTVPLSVSLACLGAAAAVGLISAFLPARSAARTSILDALGHTG